jgi:hypothetical protein
MASVAFSKAVKRASLANAPPSVRVQVATITNQLDRLLTHAHPSLAFKNIEAAASGYDQQQQNPSPRFRSLEIFGRRTRRSGTSSTTGVRQSTHHQTHAPQQSGKVTRPFNAHIHFAAERRIRMERVPLWAGWTIFTVKR